MVAVARALVDGEAKAALTEALGALALASGHHGAALVLPDDLDPQPALAVATWGRLDGPSQAIMVRGGDGLRGVVELRGPGQCDLPGLELAAALAVDAALHQRLAQRKVDDRNRMALLAEAAFEGILIHDGSRILDANRALAELVGTTREALLGSSIWDHAAPEESENILSRIRAGYQGRYRTLIVHRTGERIPVEMQARQVERDGSLHRVVAVRDIRHVLQAERAARETEDRIRALLDVSYDGIAVGRVTDSVIVDANEGFAALFGLTREECLGLDSSRLATPESFRIIRRNVQSGHEQPYEIVCVRKDGSRFPCRVHGRQANWNGEPVRITGFRDLTTERRHQAEHQALEQQLRHAQKLESLGVMAGGVAHDFNNLLGVIQGHGELAELALREQRDARPHLAQVLEAAARAAELTSKLLAYTGREAYDVTTVDIGAMLGEMARLLAVAVPPKVRLVTEPPVRPALVQADAASLRQVLMNLITNAAEAIEGNQGEVRVRTLHREVRSAELVGAHHGDQPPVGPCVVIEVQDDGAGMTQKVQARIFDPFFTTKFAGRGLGLAAVLGIIRAHGGAIQVDSRPERGTTFRIILPDGAKGTPSQAHAPARAAPSPGRGLALIADDEPGLREILRLMLGRVGLDAELAADGLEAVRAFDLRRDAWVLAVLDITMPGRSGTEVLTHIRQHCPDLPVLLVSGYDEPDGLAALGPDPRRAFLHKPFTLDRLRSAVHTLLASRGG